MNNIERELINALCLNHFLRESFATISKVGVSIIFKDDMFVVISNNLDGEHLLEKAFGKDVEFIDNHEKTSIKTLSKFDTDMILFGLDRRKYKLPKIVFDEKEKRFKEVE